MSRSRTIGGLIRLLRIPSSLLFCAIGSAVLGATGYPRVAAGVGIGLGIHLLNLFLLVETNRSTVTASGRRRAALAAGGGSVARYLMMASALAGIGLFLDREILLGACGGLFVAQVNLHIARRNTREAK